MQALSWSFITCLTTPALLTAVSQGPWLPSYPPHKLSRWNLGVIKRHSIDCLAKPGTAQLAALEFSAICQHAIAEIQTDPFITWGVPIFYCPQLFCSCFNFLASVALCCTIKFTRKTADWQNMCSQNLSFAITYCIKSTDKPRRADLLASYKFGILSNDIQNTKTIQI